MQPDPEKFYLLGLDPGLMTGACLVDITTLDEPVMVWSEEWTIADFHDKIGHLMEMKNISVVIEDFKITVETAKLTPQPWSLHLIGVTLYLGYINNVKVKIQTPSQKPFATNDRLRAVGFWHVGEDGHANDAARHAMIWIVEKNRQWAKKLLV